MVTGRGRGSYILETGLQNLQEGGVSGRVWNRKSGRGCAYKS